MRTFLTVIAMLVLLPGSAFATECNNDADCLDGESCMMLPCTCSCEACPDGEEECPPCECEEECENMGECVPSMDDKEREVDEDCPEGMECFLMGMSTCACPPCPEGQECEPCDCPEEDSFGYCMYPENPWDDFGGIVAGECDTDADCPVEFLCEEIAVPCNTMPDCPPCACAGCDPDDEDCTEVPECECPDCPEPTPCEEETAHLCVFNPTECEGDPDCIEGFECVEMEECSGGGGGDCMCTECVCADCPDGEECECDCPEEPVCECDEEPQDWEESCEVILAICLPKEVPCETDDDCAGDFVCMEDPQDTDCACPGCACPDCPEGEECEPCDCPPCECDKGQEEEGGEGYCVPDGWDEADFWGGEQGGSTMSGEENDKDEGEEPTAPDPDGGEAEEETEDGVNDNLGGEGGGTGETGGTESESSGCSAAGNASPFALMLLIFALMGLAVLRRSPVKM